MTAREDQKSLIEQEYIGIDQLAPDFEARSTEGTVRLSDFRGRWLIFFSHPADFTPVCTSEFIAFQGAASQFEMRHCALLALSVDSLYAHIAWVRDIERRFGVKIRFPIIEDISMSISRAYGMIHEASSTTAAVRSVYFIDPGGLIRAMIHYPMTVGRSVDELLRVLAALQESAEREESTPAGWSPGDALVLPPPTDTREADRRAGADDAPWYFTPAKVKT
ncbi:MAG: peroxiredoxin [Alphaproteobacteria bacterium]|nr:peroxiredoxin [Alphaproteobacteria bacterium]